MKRNVVNSQLYNFKTYLAYKDRMISLAKNVFKFNNIPFNIDMSKVNNSLLVNGSIAWFKDDVTKELMALPYTNVGALDLYGRPRAIMITPYFGAYKRVLYKSRGEFVIMYDNEARVPLYPQIIAASERMALIKRAIDINISQQNTNRIWKVPEDQLLSFNKVLEQVDSNVENIATFDGLDLNSIGGFLNTAPFVADKLNTAKHEEWAEFLELIGISNVKVEKKERLITDEIESSMGGTIAGRYNRFESRRKAIDEINKLFNTNISVEFYDGLPTTLREETSNEEITNIEDKKEVVENV